MDEKLDKVALSVIPVVEKNKGGRPKVEIDWRILDEVIVWASSEFCAEKLGMCNDTLVKGIKEKYGMSFSEYKEKRREPLKINLLVKQYEIAMKGNVTMLIWLGKQHLGQSDQLKVKDIGQDDHDVEFV